MRERKGTEESAGPVAMIREDMSGGRYGRPRGERRRTPSRRDDPRPYSLAPTSGPRRARGRGPTSLARSDDPRPRARRGPLPHPDRTRSPTPTPDKDPGRWDKGGRDQTVPSAPPRPRGRPPVPLAGEVLREHKDVGHRTRTAPLAVSLGVTSALPPFCFHLNSKGEMEVSELVLNKTVFTESEQCTSIYYLSRPVDVSNTTSSYS